MLKHAGVKKVAKQAENVIKIATSIFSILILIILVVIIFNVDCTIENMYSLRLIDLIRLLLMVVMGGGVAYYITSTNSHTQKKNDVCLDLIGECLDLLHDQEEIVKNFILTKDENQYRKGVVNGFRSLKNKIQSIKNVCDKIGNIKSINIVNNKIDFIKESFWDTPIKLKDHKDSDYFDKEFSLLEKFLDDVRIEILR